MDRSRLAIIIPCHNEASTIAQVVTGALAYGQVLVVDDRSTDNSRQEARYAGARVTSSLKPGYDGALETGLAEARNFEFVITMDADGEHDPATLADFITEFERGAALVCGIRPRPQRLAERVICRWGRRRLGIHDLMCGMKGYSAAVLRAWWDARTPLSVNMAPAVIWRRAGGPFAQVPVRGHPRRDRPRFGRAFSANLKLLKVFAGLLLR